MTKKYLDYVPTNKDPMHQLDLVRSFLNITWKLAYGDESISSDDVKLFLLHLFEQLDSVASMLEEECSVKLEELAILMKR